MNPIFYIWRKSVTFKPRQDKTRHDKAWQGKARRGQTRQDEAAPRQEGVPWFWKILYIREQMEVKLLFTFKLFFGRLDVLGVFHTENNERTLVANGFCTYEMVTLVFIPQVAKQWGINPKETLKWAQRQFVASLYAICYFLHDTKGP